MTPELPYGRSDIAAVAISATLDQLLGYFLQHQPNAEHATGTATADKNTATSHNLGSGNISVHVQLKVTLHCRSCDPVFQCIEENQRFKASFMQSKEANRGWP